MATREVDLCSITELRDYKATREEVDLFNNLRATGLQDYEGSRSMFNNRATRLQGYEGGRSMFKNP
jgi:hypothetical protein